MPASKKSSKPLLLLLLIPAIIAIWYFFLKSSPIKKFDQVKPSEDQKELISSFGYPNTFSLTMNSDNRYEIWTYYDMARSFIFHNGTFVEDQIIDEPEQEFQFPDFRPTQFSADMTLKDINKILGDFTVQADINSKLIENAKVYDYFDQVKIGTKDDKVTYVETLPVFVPEEFRIKNEK